MPRSTKDLCHASLTFLVNEGLLHPFVPSGHYHKPATSRPLLAPENARLVHYATCEGPLYQHKAHWRFAYHLVRSFTRQRDLKGRFLFPRLYGDIQKVKAVDFLAQLPFAFEKCGFHCQSKSEVARSALFVSTGSWKLTDLPEPYGKWCQIERRAPQWDELVELEVEVTCQLSSPTINSTRLDLVLSSLALPLLDDLREQLARLFVTTSLAPPPHKEILAMIRRSWAGL